MTRQNSNLLGVVAAVATPLTDGTLHEASFRRHINMLERDGCDGILLLGTTGEGPSFSLDERKAVLERGREDAGDMLVMGGTGCASLPETIELTRFAFDIGIDAVVVVPPFYFKNVPDEGLLSYYQKLLDDAVPENGRLLLYHIPQVSGVPISFNLLEKLLDSAGQRIAGIKDSSGQIDHSRQLCHQFPELNVFVGDDKLLHQGLQFGASGCITAGANVLAPLAANVYRAFQSGDEGEAGSQQEKLTVARRILDAYTPFPASIKGLLGKRYGSVTWEVRPPLTPLPETKLAELTARLRDLQLDQQSFDWLS